MKKIKKILLFTILNILSFANAAIYITPQFENTQQTQIYNHLVTIIRCPTCQNQNIAESNAILARKLREQIEMQIKNGNSEQQIIDNLIISYGDFITYATPFNINTFLLWITPIIIMLIFLLSLIIKKRNPHIKQLSITQKKELQIMIDDIKKKNDATNYNIDA